jgi:hypothetical protein
MNRCSKYFINSSSNLNRLCKPTNHFSNLRETDFRRTISSVLQYALSGEQQNKAKLHTLNSNFRLIQRNYQIAYENSRTITKDLRDRNSKNNNNSNNHNHRVKGNYLKKSHIKNNSNNDTNNLFKSIKILPNTQAVEVNLGEELGGKLEKGDHLNIKLNN